MDPKQLRLECADLGGHFVELSARHFASPDLRSAKARWASA
jgi:hypothetical protein